MRKMRKGFFFLLGTLALFFLGANTARGAERILSFHSDITVNEDTSLTVVETIRVTAERNQIRRGIFRDFPQLYKGTFGLRRRRGLEVQEVLRDGKPENYVLENILGGTRIKIGRESVLLKKGTHTYTIKYKTTRQLGYFENHDELYWNVTGNGWAFPIDKASATVRLPGGAVHGELHGFTGKAGSKRKKFLTETRADQSVYFETTEPLSKKEGLTIVVEWPKGMVNYKADPQGAEMLMKENPGVIIGLFGLLALMGYYSVVWAMKGRDPEKGTVIPLYDPPPGFSPAAVRNLYKMGFDDKTFSAAVISLASKGVIKIEEDDGEYTLRKTGESGDLTEDESALFNKLMVGSSLKLKRTNHARIRSGKTTLKENLAGKLKKSHFVRNVGPWAIGLLIALVFLAAAVALHAPAGFFILLWLTIWTFGTTMLVSGVITSWKAGKKEIFGTIFAIPFVLGWIAGVVAFVLMVSPILAIIFALSAIAVGVFYHLMKASTVVGRKVLDHIEGFKQYLSVAEADRLNLINPPDRTPELFERFLPYAVALDVDQEWAEQFSDVLAVAGQQTGSGTRSYSPSFYSGSSANGLMTAGALTSVVAGSLTSALASSSVNPSSSSGSGGSSGGGGGGGGGGGW